MAFWKQKTPSRDVAALSAGLSRPAVHVAKGEGPGRSHFGGMPNLPAGTAWPERNGARLGFLARLSLAEIRAAHAFDWLPADGALLFFYDLDEQPWGFDPKDRGGAAVVRVPDIVVTPPGPVERDAAAPIAFRRATFRRLDSLPNRRDELARLDLDEPESDAYTDLVGSRYGDQPKHQVGGYPVPVQGDDMELEAQLVSHGLYCGDPSGYEDARAKALEPGAADWRLLFQFDTDDGLEVMWGDCGMLYFWVRADDSRRGDFSGAWLILQCG
jgi:hypothetical protein